MRAAKFPKSTRVNWLARSFVRILVGIGILAVSSVFAFGQAISHKPTPVLTVSSSCPRSTVGSTAQRPPDLSSVNGVLNVSFSYQQTTDSDVNPLHCFVTPDGIQDRTLDVKPGHILNVTVTNTNPRPTFGEAFNPPPCVPTTVHCSPPLGSIQTAKKNNFQLRVTSWVACTRSHKVCRPGSDVTTKIVHLLSDAKA